MSQSRQNSQSYENRGNSDAVAAGADSWAIGARVDRSIRNRVRAAAALQGVRIPEFVERALLLAAETALASAGDE